MSSGFAFFSICESLRQPLVYFLPLAFLHPSSSSSHLPPLPSPPSLIYSSYYYFFCFSTLAPGSVLAMDKSSLHCEGPNKTERTPVNISNNVTAPAQIPLANKQISSMEGQSAAIKSDPSSPSRKDPQPAKPPATAGNNLKFEFVKSDDLSSSEDGQAQSKRLRQDEVQNGDHRSLIEDLHNVERREDQPKKRIKTTEDEKPIARTKPQFEVSGNSGLGEYMKEGKQAPNSTAQVVDLTSGKTNDHGTL